MTQSLQPAGLPPAGRFALLAALFSSVGQTFFIGLFGADFRAEFGLSDAGLGALYSGATLVSGISMFWLGGLADHLSLKRAVTGVVALLAFGAWLVSSASGAWMLLPGLFLIRLCGQGLMGHLGVVAAGRYAVRRRGRALAMVSYGFILGEACFPPLVALALDQYDWRSVWMVASLAMVLIALPLLAWLARTLTGNPAADDEAGPAEPRSGSDSNAVSESESAPVSVSESGLDSSHGVDTAPLLRRHRMLTHGAFLRVLLVVLVPPVLITAVFLHQGSIAERQGWMLLQVGQAFIVFALAQAGAAFLTGRLIDRFSARVLLYFQLLPAALGVLSLGLLEPRTSLWTMFIGLGITAGFNGVISAAIWVELFGTRQLGMIRGVYAALMVVSTAVGPVLLGGLLDLGTSLLTIGLAVTAYALVVPAIVVPAIVPHRRAAPAGN